MFGQNLEMSAIKHELLDLTDFPGRLGTSGCFPECFLFNWQKNHRRLLRIGGGWRLTRIGIVLSANFRRF